MSATARPKKRRLDDQMRISYMIACGPTTLAESQKIAARNPSVIDLQAQIDVAQTCEALGMDAVFFPDSFTESIGMEITGPVDPTIFPPIWAPIVAHATKRIGIITTLNTTLIPPVVIARLGANMDYLSGGRWGWNVVTGWREDEAQMFGHDSLMDHDRRYEMGFESVDIAKLIWQNDGAIDFSGEFFRSKGQLRGPSPLQEPWPLIVNAGISEIAQSYATKHCDYIFFTLGDDFAVGKQSIDRVATLTADAGRDPREVTMLAGVGAIVAPTRSEAHDKYQRLLEEVDDTASLSRADKLIENVGTYKAWMEDADLKVKRSVGLSVGGHLLIGTAADIAEQMIEINRETGLRGFNFCNPLWGADEIAMLADAFPILAKAGVWTHPDEREWSW
jgi:alkanesulfonate monooxygenase SsuD/methylene tetrahydromethanopterin reductase-like flavin-dependent oxidoreductase (luciferase family)